MQTLAKYDVKEITWPEKTFLTKRAVIELDRITDFFGESFGEIYDVIEKFKIESYDPPCAIYYSVDEDNWETDLAAAIPVRGELPPLNLDKITIPESKVIMVTYYGDYDHMGPAYAALEKYVVSHKLEKRWMIEEYLSNPAPERDQRRWKTNIYFVVR